MKVVVLYILTVDFVHYHYPVIHIQGVNEHSVRFSKKTFYRFAGLTTIHYICN